ncbi:MAG: iron-containing alcohol dehydrogenase [Candidatus Lokiarchaeota archaeon]|nr:iron-containing alcohol dehydrogenase [Candidatus Lokiarchaeota archaeon]
MFLDFNLSSIPHIIFGAGRLNEIYELIPQFGNNVLYVIGRSSLKKSGKWDEIEYAMHKNSINFSEISVNGEPTPILVDESVKKFRNQKIDLVVGIGGGSVIDAGKAISAMLPKMDTIKNYLEGVGNKTHDGRKIPYIAVPTTSGTGSEATKNAVITEVGIGGFKKSLRHDNLIPNYAIIDPQLVLSCPRSVSSSCGMDAFTQLLEGFVSPKANPITDELAKSGIKQMKDAIVHISSEKASDITVRTSMAYGSLISGIVLANAGLGVVHGFASSIGSLFNIPHGVVCGTLLAESTKMNINRLEQLGTKGENGLLKYAIVGVLINGRESFENINVPFYCSILVKTLENWTKQLNIDRLSKYGVTTADIDNIIDRTGLKNNPVHLKREDMNEILINRI